MIPLSIDTETHLITDLDKAPPLVCVSYASKFDRGLFKWNSDWGTRPCQRDARELIADWLENPDLLLVGVNIAFDMAVIMRQWPELTPLIFEAYEQNRVCDPSVSCKLVDNAEGIMHRHPVTAKGSNGKPTCYSLAALSKRFRGVELDKETWRLGYESLRDVPLAEWPEGARKYPVDDAVAALEIHEAIQLGYPDLIKDQFRQTRHAFWLYLVGAHGIVTDPERVAQLEKRLRRDFDYNVERLIAAGLVWPKKKKNPKTQQYEWSKNTKAAKSCMVLAHGGFERVKKTEGGDVSLDKEACDEAPECAHNPADDRGTTLLQAYQEITSIGKRLGTEIKALKLGEIHCRFDSFKTNGRTGSSDPTNLQNLPREGGERECYVPRPGFVFFDLDFDMLELRTWAQVCLETVGESTLADDINGGIDVHLSMAGEIFDGGGHDYDEMKARKKEPRVKEARQTAKPVNFMLPGGGGAETLVRAAKKDYGIIFPDDHEKDWTYTKVDGEWVKNYRVKGIHFARELIKAWKRKRPEAQPYLDMVSEMVEAAGGKAVLKALFVDRYHGGLGYCDLANFHFSCLANDAAKDAGWRVVRNCYDWTQGSILYGCRVVNFPHDQVIGEAPLAIAHEAAFEARRCMIQEASKWLPDVPPTTSPCLALAFSKLAEAYWTCDNAPGCKHEHCRLVPWSVEGQCAKDLAEWINRARVLWEQERKAA